MESLLLMVAMIAVFYFLIIRPENKRKKQAEQMRSSLKKGDRVTTIGGMVGKIVQVNDSTIVFETSEDRVRIEVTKWAVQSTGAMEQAAAQKSGKKADKVEEKVDEMYLKNGAEDYYYRRMRENTVFAVMGCKESGKNCFCVSMGTNRCEEYDMYIFQDEKGCYMELRCRELEELLWDYGQNAQEKLTFVEKNEIHVEIPEKLPDAIHQDPMWQEYGSRCIGCGRCNFVCPTCTCFTMQDIFYKDNPKAGERRRVWASCQVDGYSDIAGGHSFRQSQGERMRLRYYIKLQIIRKDLDIICVSAVDVVKMSVRNIFPMLHAFRN